MRQILNGLKTDYICLLRNTLSSNTEELIGGFEVLIRSRISSSGKSIYGFLGVILLLGFTLTFLLSGQSVHLTKEITMTAQAFSWSFTSPGIQRCTITTDPSNNITLSVTLDYGYSDLGETVEFQLDPGQTQVTDLPRHAGFKSTTYSIYHLFCTFYSPHNFTPQNVTITVTVLTTTLPVYLTNWMNTSTWEAPIMLLFSLFLSIPLTVISFLWKKLSLKTVFVGSTCFFWALFLCVRFYLIRAYSLYTLSLLPILVSIGLIGFIILCWSFLKGSPSKPQKSEARMKFDQLFESKAE